MNRLFGALPGLQAALCLPGGAPNGVASGAAIDGLVRSIRRKARVAKMHGDLLDGIVWEQVDAIGRRGSLTSALEVLSIQLNEATLTIEHPGAVIDHVYIAFDGLTAALVNMTDTIARALNLAYSLGIDERRTSLFAVRDKCAVTSALGVALYDSQNTEWLKKVRELRGTCQHADVESVLTAEAAPYSKRAQPLVVDAYSWSTPPQATRIVQYAKDAVVAAENCMLAVMTAITTAPANPIY